MSKAFETAVNVMWTRRNDREIAKPIDWRVGKRVEIAPHYDLWMRGARYGEVRHVIGAGDTAMLKIKMDHPQVRKFANIPAHHVTFL